MLYTLVLNKGGLGVRSPLKVEVPARLGCALRAGAVPSGAGAGRVGGFESASSSCWGYVVFMSQRSSLRSATENQGGGLQVVVWSSF